MQELSQDVTQVNALITQAGQNMQQMVQKREDDLLNLYKQEMLKVQRKLKKLSEESSESEIRKKIQQHREQLENERQQYVKQSVELSNQVQELRKREKEILQSTQELLSDINFLDEQLIYADKHNLILQEELESLQEDYQRSYTQSKSQRFVQSQQGIQLPKLNNDRTNINKLKQTNEKLRQQINNQEEDEIERCFDEAIASVSETDISTMDLTCCNEFNEFQKRKIFEEFLQHPIYITYINFKPQRGKNKSCNICSKEFSITNSEHQCKRCLRAVCEKCAINKAFNLKKNGELSKKPHRQCTICKDEQDQMKQFIEQYKIQYGVDTFAREWLKEYGQLETALKDYQEAKDSIRQKVERTEVAGFENLNYSLQDFYYHVKQDQNKIKNVVLTLVGKYPEIPFTADLVVLTGFILCFASEHSAFALLVIIYKQIVPSYFTKTTDFKNEQQMIINVSQKALNLSDDERPALGTFLENRVRRYLTTFSLNLFLFETSFHLINQLFMKYELFIKTLASALMINIQVIKKSHINFDESELYIFRNLRQSQLLMTAMQTKTVQLSNDFIQLSDQTLIANLRMEISALKMKLNVQQADLDGLQFQLQQQQNPDATQKQLYVKQKNEEIQQLHKQIGDQDSKIQILQQQLEAEILKNQQLGEQMKTYQINSFASTNGSSDRGSSNLLREQQDTIDRLQNQIEYYKIKQNDQDAFIQQKAEQQRLNKKKAYSDANQDDEILRLQDQIQEMQEKHKEEIELLNQKINELENKNSYTLRDVDKLKRIIIEISFQLDNIKINDDIIQISNQNVAKQRSNDIEDVQKIIETKSCQNQLLKEMLKKQYNQIKYIVASIGNIKRQAQFIN